MSDALLKGRIQAALWEVIDRQPCVPYSLSFRSDGGSIRLSDHLSSMINERRSCI